MAEDFTPSPYDAVIADLESKREQITGMIETLKQMKSFAMSLPGGPAPTSKPAEESTFKHDAFFGMPIQEAAKKYLTAVKRTKPHTELCDSLLKFGLKTSAANFRETARASLSRHFDFVKVNGEWGLADWYPGLRRDRKPSSRKSGFATNDGEAAEPSVDVDDNGGASNEQNKAAA